MTLPLHILYQPDDIGVGTVYTTHQYAAHLWEHLKATFTWAEMNLEATAKVSKTYYGWKTSHEYQVDEKVLYFRFTIPVGFSKKFLPIWKTH